MRLDVCVEVVVERHIFDVSLNKMFFTPKLNLQCQNLPCGKTTKSLGSPLFCEVGQMKILSYVRVAGTLTNHKSMACTCEF